MTPRLKVLIAGTALIAVTNAVAIGGALYNRSGTPESTLTLTQRELSPPYEWGFHAEDSGLALDLHWRTVHTRDDAEHGLLVEREADWLGPDRLEALGFDLSVPPDAEGARRHYERQLPRATFVALEFDGPAHVATLKRAQGLVGLAESRAAVLGDKAAQVELESARERLERERTQNSRLYAVDVGVDAAALRAAHPDTERYAIVRGRVGIGLCERAKKPRVCGALEGLDLPRIHVPRSQRAAFEGARPVYRDNETAVRYSAVVAFGRRLEPWLVSAEREPQAHLGTDH